MNKTAPAATAWRKSSYSDDNGGNCIEVALPTPAFRKSSYSGDNGGNCIEVALTTPASAVPVRDSKDPQGPALQFSSDAWASFVDGIKRGDFPAA